MLFSPSFSCSFDLCCCTVLPPPVRQTGSHNSHPNLLSHSISYSSSVNSFTLLHLPDFMAFWGSLGSPGLVCRMLLNFDCSQFLGPTLQIHILRSSSNLSYRRLICYDISTSFLVRRVCMQFCFIFCECTLFYRERGSIVLYRVPFVAVVNCMFVKYMPIAVCLKRRIFFRIRHPITCMVFRLFGM
uniref:Uncharacterized protein n=1 Tax=Physcomitrium patens TaxID=3218 RepID=A0A7I4ETA9_PHYPA